MGACQLDNTWKRKETKLKIKMAKIDAKTPGSKDRTRRERKKMRKRREMRDETKMEKEKRRERIQKLRKFVRRKIMVNNGKKNQILSLPSLQFIIFFKKIFTFIFLLIVKYLILMRTKFRSGTMYFF